MSGSVGQSGQCPVPERTQAQGLIVTAASASPAGMPGPSTLDCPAGRQSQKRVVFPDQSIQGFFLSGLSATIEDEEAALSVLDMAMPFITNKTANFALVYNQKLELQSSVFEKNPGFVKRRVCGKGACGQVEAFFDTRSQVSFVRKRFKDGSSFRKEEVQSLIKLNHPGVVKVYALLCAAGTVDLLLEDAGYPLPACLKMFCQQKIRVEKYWGVVEDLAKQGFAILKYIHEKGIGHLDVKPENFLVHQAGSRLVLVLADFGSSVTLTDTMTFNIALTPEYWAPELWRLLEQYLEGRRMWQSVHQDCYQFSPQASFDTYSMGLCVYFMGTRRHLVKQLEDRQKTDPPLILSQVIQQACQHFGTSDISFVFKLLLTKQYSHLMPEWATAGSWLFPAMPVSLLTVMRETLSPDPHTRWTDQQAASFLEGKSGSGKDKPELKTPKPVEDTSDCYGESSQAEQARCDAELTPCLPSAADTSVRQAGAAGGMSTKFNQVMTSIMKPWVQTPASAGPSQVTAPQKQQVNASIPVPANQRAQEDLVVGVDPRLYGAAAKQPSTRKNIVHLRCDTPMDMEGFPDMDSGAGPEGTIEIDLKSWEMTSEMLDELKPFIAAVDGVGVEKGEGDCGIGEEGESVGAMMEDRAEKAGRGTVMSLRENLNVSVTPDPQPDSKEPAIQQLPLAVDGRGKGGGKGKGRGKSKPVKLGQKGEERREGVGKVMPRSPLTKSKGRGKAVVGKKTLPLVSAQVSQQPVSEIPFVVASSNLPKPVSRTLRGWSCHDPGTSTRAAGRTPTAGNGSLGVVRPPEAVSAVKRHLRHGGDASPVGGVGFIAPQDSIPENRAVPRTGSGDPFAADRQSKPDQFSLLRGDDHLQGHPPVFGNQSLVPGVSGQLQQHTKGFDGSFKASLVASPDLGPTVLSAAADTGLQLGGAQPEPKVLGQGETDELLALLGPLLNQRPEFQEQVLPEGGLAWPAQTSTAGDVYVAEMNEAWARDGLVKSMIDGLSLDEGQMAGGLSLDEGHMTGGLSLDEGHTTGGLSLGEGHTTGGLSLDEAHTTGGLFLAEGHMIVGGLSLGEGHMIDGGLSLGEGHMIDGLSLGEGQMTGGLSLGEGQMTGGLSLDEGHLIVDGLSLGEGHMILGGLPMGGGQMILGGLPMGEGHMTGGLPMGEGHMTGGLPMGEGHMTGGLPMGEGHMTGGLPMGEGHMTGGLPMGEGHMTLDGCMGQMRHMTDLTEGVSGGDEDTPDMGEVLSPGNIPDLGALGF